MPVDPHVQALLDGLAEQGMKSFEQIGVAATRAVVETFTGLQRPAPAVARVIDGTYPGPVGAQPLRIYIPEGEGPLPIVVYFHGGGFVAGGLAVVDEPARALANDVGAIVVAAGYRLAPEHKFPAATDDTFAALRWVADHAADFGGDPARIAVMGDSAGGSLAAVAAQRARDARRPAARGAGSRLSRRRSDRAAGVAGAVRGGVRDHRRPGSTGSGTSTWGRRRRPRTRSRLRPRPARSPAFRPRWC